MSSDPRKAPVRTRVRRLPTPHGPAQERLVADPAPAGPRKRLPNSGSMKPGETRNPNGRPKGAKGTRAIVKKVLSSKTTIRENGRLKKVTIYEALVRKELQLASEGDYRARKTILELGRWAIAEEPAAPSAATTSGRGGGNSLPAAEQSAVDAAILAWFEEEIALRGGKVEDQ